AAPERAAQPSGDARADIWSLGACLYFLLTGRPPFPATSPAEFLQQLQSAEPLGVDQLRNDLPAPLADYVHRLLSRDAGLRPGNAEEIARFLAPYCQFGPAPVARPLPPNEVLLASETSTIPNAKLVAEPTDELPLAESLPHVEPLPL